MASLLPNGKQAYTTGLGGPLVGGQVFTYAAGTNTPLPTWADASQTVPNTNPVILDARGEASIFWSGAYKVVLRDAAGGSIWTQDNLLAEDAAATLEDSLATAGGAGLIGFSHANNYPPNTVGSKEQQIINLYDAPYNAKGNGTDSDTAALQAAIAALPAHGGEINLGVGVFRFGKINITKSVSIVGQRSEEATVVLAESATEDVFAVRPGASGSAFRRLHFKNMVPRTNGAYIDVEDADRVTVDEFRMDGHFLGIAAGNMVKLDISRGFIWRGTPSAVAPFGAGVQIGRKGYTGSVSLRDVLMSCQQDDDIYGDSYQPSFGVDLLHCDIISMANVGTVYQGTGLSIRPGIGQFVTYVSTDAACMMDTSRQGLVIAPTGGLIADGGGFVGHCTFGGQFDAHHLVAGGVLDSTNGEISDVTFSSGSKFLNNFAATVGVLLKGPNTQGVTFSDVYAGNNGTVGIYLMAGSDIRIRMSDFGKRGFTPKQITSVLVANGVSGSLDLCSSNDTFAYSNLSPNFFVNGVPGP